MSKCKRWVFTHFDLSREPAYDAESIEYIIYGRETCPDTGRRHLQGFMVFKNWKNLCTVKKWLPGAHFERCKGTISEASTYCKKDGDFSEFGTLPTDERKCNAYRDCIVKTERGEIDSIKDSYPGLFLHYKTNILSSQCFDSSALENSCGVWICGPPRIWKDFAVRHYQPLYVKSLNKWWDGYGNQPYVLISDVDVSHCVWLASFLKIWADMYPFLAEIKGGTILIRPKRIIVTSNFRMEDCFSSITLDALKARFNVYDFFGPESTFVPRLEASPNYTVLDMLKKHEKLEGLVTLTSDNTTTVEVGEVEEQVSASVLCSVASNCVVPCSVPCESEVSSLNADAGVCSDDDFQPVRKKCR